MCANHYITSDMKLEPMGGNMKAWVWIANDFADEEVNGKIEKFAVRFKDVETATAFSESFGDCAVSCVFLVYFMIKNYLTAFCMI